MSTSLAIELEELKQKVEGTHKKVCTVQNRYQDRKSAPADLSELFDVYKTRFKDVAVSLGIVISEEKFWVVKQQQAHTPVQAVQDPKPTLALAASTAAVSTAAAAAAKVNMHVPRKTSHSHAMNMKAMHKQGLCPKKKMRASVRPKDQRHLKLNNMRMMRLVRRIFDACGEILDPETDDSLNSENYETDDSLNSDTLYDA